MRDLAKVQTSQPYSDINIGRRVWVSSDEAKERRGTFPGAAISATSRNRNRSSMNGATFQQEHLIEPDNENDKIGPN